MAVRRAFEATIVTTLFGFAVAKIEQLDAENQRLRAELARHEDHRSTVACIRGASTYAGGQSPRRVGMERRTVSARANDQPSTVTMSLRSTLAVPTPPAWGGPGV